MTNAIRDGNHITVALGVSSTDSTNTLPLTIDSATGRLLTNSASGSGDVVGPSSSTNNAVARFDTTTGKLLQNSAVIIADTTGVITGTEGVTLSGTSSGTTALIATAAASGTITFPAATDTLVGKATTDTLTNKTINQDGTGNSITNLANASIKAAAAIDLDKLAALTASEIAISDASGFIVSAAVASYPSLTELAYVKGLSSAVQTQLDAKGTGTWTDSSTSTGSNKTFVAPALGTPASGVMTNVSGTASSLTAGTATLATTITVTDNESTDEQNLVIFVADAGGSTGAHGVEMDGNLTYNPSTGTLTSTAFAGALTGNASGTSATVTGSTQASITTCSNLVTVGALDSGSITSGFTSIDVGAGAITTTGDITGGGIHATGDTASGDNAALGYTAAEGLILTGQGSTSDVTIKNDADATVLNIPTGTTNIVLGVDGTISNLILAEKASIQLDPAGGADGDYSGITFTGTGGENIDFGEVCYLKAADSEWYLANADNITTSGDVAVAIAVSSGSDGGAVTLMTHGIIKADAAFPPLTIGSAVYISAAAAGAIVVAEPTAADDVVRIVGFALTADEIMVTISPDHITVTG